MEEKLVPGLRLVPPLLALVLSACVTPPDSSTPADSPVAQGHAIAARHCAQCHAIAPAGRSRHPDAIPFRRLSELYPLEGLEEALVEGLMTGHSDMPEFKLEPESANALLAYLQSIQASADPAEPHQNTP
ncbi:MAG TPA: cytochrome c [Hyphomonadaceae bacterium]